MDYQNIPDQSDRVAIVTGANTGIGFETARTLAHKGADVTLACRSRSKGEAAEGRITGENPKGKVSFAALDLSDLESIAKLANVFTGWCRKNNAEVARSIFLGRRFEFFGVFLVVEEPPGTFEFDTLRQTLNKRTQFHRKCHLPSRTL